MEFTAYPLRVEVSGREMQEDGFEELRGVKNAGGICAGDMCVKRREWEALNMNF